MSCCVAGLHDFRFRCQAEVKRRAGAGHGFSPNLPAMTLDDALDGG